MDEKPTLRDLARGLADTLKSEWRDTYYHEGARLSGELGNDVVVINRATLERVKAVLYAADDTPVTKSERKRMDAMQAHIEYLHTLVASLMRS